GLTFQIPPSVSNLKRLNILRRKHQGPRVCSCPYKDQSPQRSKKLAQPREAMLDFAGSSLNLFPEQFSFSRLLNSIRFRSSNPRGLPAPGPPSTGLTPRRSRCLLTSPLRHLLGVSTF